MADTVVMGYACKLYRNAGTYGSPTWTECTSVKDAQMNVEMDKADASSRGSGGMKLTEPTLTAISITGSFVGKKTSGDYPADVEAFRAAAFAKTAIEVIAVDTDNATAHAQGPRMSVKVFKFNRKEGLGDVADIEFELLPCVSDNNPAWYEASGS